MNLESDRCMQMLRKEGNAEPIKHRDIRRIKKGRAVESKPTGILKCCAGAEWIWRGFLPLNIDSLNQPSLVCVTGSS